MKYTAQSDQPGERGGQNGQNTQGSHSKAGRYRPTRHVPKQARAQEKIRQILSAAAFVLERDGLEKTTTNSIAAHAGLPVGSIYKYYQNKQAVLASLIELYCDDLSGQLDSLVGNPLVAQSSPDEFVDSLLDTWLSYMTDNRPFVICSILKTDPGLQADVAACNQRVHAALGRLISAKSGDDRDVEQRAVAVMTLLVDITELMAHNLQPDAAGTYGPSDVAVGYLRRALAEVFTGQMPAERPGGSD